MTPSGVLLIDKPAGPTSHAVVAAARRLFPDSKIGHLGTLDPFASGLLPILIGGITRMSDELMAGVKGYDFTIQLGSETDTLDPVGRVVAEAAIPSSLTVEQLEAVLQPFRGTINQIPPVYSALKHKGRPLYEYMRTRGHLDFDIASKTRSVEILELLHMGSAEDLARGEIRLRTRCSKGTYIRSMARDIALALGTVGHCSALRRIQVGEWHIENATHFDPEVMRSAGPRLGEWAALLGSKILAVEDIFSTGDRQYPFLRIPEDATQHTHRINAGNRIIVDFEECAQWRQKGPWAPSASVPWHGFIETTSSLFFAEFSGSEVPPGEPATARSVLIEPKKRISSGGTSPAHADSSRRGHDAPQANAQG